MRLSTLSCVAACATALCIGMPDASAAAHPRNARPATPVVNGTVKDSAGTPLPNVTINIAAVRRSATSDVSGRFTFRGLPPGHHHLDAALIGFARAEAEVEVPESGPDVTVTIVMRQSAVRLSNVVISASPTGGDPLGITQSTVDLGGKELQKSLSTSIAQTLEREPGLAMRYNGPAATLPVIRGLTGERILVLQDGERSGDLSSAAPDHGLSIDPLSADRIEVVRGPASLLYGTAALGGVVNVISNDIPTSVPSHVSGYLAGTSESVHPGAAGSASFTVPLGTGAALTLGGGLRNAQPVKMGGDETLLNSDARDNHQHAGLALIGDKGSIGASYRRYKFIYGLPGEAGDDELGLKIDGQRDEGSLRVDLGGGRGAFRGLSVTGTAQAYKHSEIENTGEVGTAFDLKTQTGAATAKTAFGSIEGAIGASGLFKQYAATGEEALTPAADTKSFGLFLFEQMPLGQATEHGVNLQFGARLDTYSIESKAGDPKFGSPRSRDFTAFSGSLGVTIPFGPQASLGVNVARAFRAPTVEELFSNAFHAAEGAYDVGNPDLDPETNNGIEGVYRIQASKVNGQFSAYFNKIDNYIVPDIRGDTLFEGELVPLNRFSQSNATLKGIEGSVEGEVVRHVVVGVQGDVVRATLSGGDNVPFMPPARLGARARWDNGRFNVGGEVRHGFKQDKVSGGDLDVPTDAYTLVNLTAGFSMISAGRVHTVTLRLDNATDEQYADATSFIKSFAFNPGRNVALVYKVLF